MPTTRTDEEQQQKKKKNGKKNRFGATGKHGVAIVMLVGGGAVRALELVDHRDDPVAVPSEDAASL